MRQEIKNLMELQNATREFCDALLSCGVPQERAFDCRLIASELLSNAIKHSGAQATLRWLVTVGQVELWVISTVPYTPPSRSKCSDILAEHGRGMYLVDSFSFERTTTDDGAIKVVVKWE